ncbi:NAD(P)H-binding protein [uncultured Veillonella sp.]|uniref:NAD(P)H-binding protein n=1 Tax=uncultured Veillonella sp. TaxID=159268 RepID=UPI0025E2EF3E|nr:NAD(P)H-binding protein [uncultured Veillonella sp.]
MKALILGASGATGRDVLNLLLQDDRYEEVVIFVRKSLGISHKKLVTHLVNFDRISEWGHLLTGDVLFSCLGTTRKAAGSKELQWKVDYAYQFQVAQMAKQQGVTHYILVSSVGADSGSSFFYLRMKGQLEEAIKQLNFTKTTIVQPPSLIRKAKEKRWSEGLSVKLLNKLSEFGIFTKFKPMPTEVVADAMVKASIIQAPGVVTWGADELWRI